MLKRKKRTNIEYRKKHTPLKGSETVSKKRGKKLVANEQTKTETGGGER